MAEVNVLYQSGENVPVSGLYQMVDNPTQGRNTLTKCFNKGDYFVFHRGLPVCWFLLVADIEADKRRGIQKHVYYEAV